MEDIEKVMSWLEGLAQDDWREFHSDSEVQNIAKCAMKLLKVQEMDIDALKKSYNELAEKGHPIVMCKDCKHYDEQCQQCEFLDGIILPDYFCADGERK